MIVKMNRITVLGIEDQRRALMASLMDIGAVEVSEVDKTLYGDLADNPSVSQEISALQNKIADIKGALESLGKYCPVKTGLFQNRREITETEFSNLVEKEDLVWASVKIIKEQEEQLVRLKAEENKLDNLYSSLLPWAEYNMPLETTGTRKTVIAAGTIPAAGDWDQIRRELAEKAPFSYVGRVNSDRDQHYVYVIYHKETEQECLTYLKSHGFAKVTFSTLTGVVSDNFEQLTSRLQRISDEASDAVREIENQQKSRKSMEVLYDALGMELERALATTKILKTKKVFLIKGWIPEALTSKARETLESKYTVSIDVAEPAEDEEFPVLLENRDIAEAGEPVSNMYSLPNCREIDPNAVMAPFFILFFGLMLSDGGYGIIMALIAGFILLRFKLDDVKRKFMKLVFFCGLSTIFWGILFGGWFGIDALVKYGVWLNPAEEPELLLSWSLLFGVIHMYAGFGLRAANLIRGKKYLDALFDVGFVYIFYTGFMLILLPYVPKVDKTAVAPLVNIGKYVFVAGGVLMLLTQGRDKKNIIGKFFGGLSSLYNVVGFMSDVLSYSRLLALGLATGIIAAIINQISAMFNITIILKVIIMAAVLLVGHTVNFAINALGAYVHSCRLQYLEFFGKFFTGGGMPFKPLKANTKYITVKNDAGM